MNDELSPNERDAFASLPRERATPRALEERVVDALRREGLVREPRGARTPWWSWRLVPAMAAGLALFAGGVFVGVRLAPGVSGAVAKGDPATRIEQSGASYLGALSALERDADTTRSTGRDHAREVASRTLRQAAQQVARLDPNDPMATRILGTGEVAAQVASNDATHFVWY